MKLGGQLSVKARLRLFYLAVFVTGLIFLVLDLLMPHTRWVERYGPHIVTTSAGIILVGVLAEGVVEAAREQDERRRRRVAFSVLHGPLEGHVTVLFRMFKGAVEHRPRVDSAIPANRFDDFFAEELTLFDMTAEAPPYDLEESLLHGQLREWGPYLVRHTQDFRDAIQAVIDKYALVLDPDTLDGLETLNSHEYLSRLPDKLWALDVFMKGRWVPIPSPGYVETVRGYLSTLLSVISAHDRALPDAPLRLPRDRWYRDYTPPTGSARISISGDLASNARMRRGKEGARERMDRELQDFADPPPHEEEDPQ